MPVNPGYEYVAAEKKYLNAQTLDEKIVALEEMIKTAPKHKSSENLLAGLRTRLKKFLEKKEKNKKTGKTSHKTIRKEGYQVVLVGFTNGGKSALLSRLTNAQMKASLNQFSTYAPEVGTLDYEGMKAQIVDLPSIGSQYYDSGIVNTADCIILVITSLDEVDKLQPALAKSVGKRIIVINKIDLLTQEEIRKLRERIKSKKLDAIPISCTTQQGIQELKEKIILGMDSIRIYMKEPGKNPSPVPMVLKKGSNVRNVAEHILKGFSARIKETRITGPSSKFPNQRVGLAHTLADKDIVEFHTK